MDGRPIRLHGDWYRIAEAMAWAEKTYGLTPVARVATHRSATQVPARGLAHLDPTSGVTLLSALKDQVLVQPSSVPTPAARANENLSISETA